MMHLPKKEKKKTKISLVKNSEKSSGKLIKLIIML